MNYKTCWSCTCTSLFSDVGQGVPKALIIVVKISTRITSFCGIMHSCLDTSFAQVYYTCIIVRLIQEISVLVFYAALLSSFAVCMEGQSCSYGGREHWLRTTQPHALSDLRDSPERGTGSVGLLQPHPHTAETTASRGLHVGTEGKGDTSR